MRMPELPTNGARLWYEQRGDGPPVLLIHGTSSSARMWGEEVAQLGRLRAPVLLAAAAHAPAAFRRITGELAAAIPGSRAVLVDGGHLISPADPAVRGFLAGLPS
jgi:pimeloyl-ACP methyl ester carboxylesterase